jgi:hypothetical protein
MILFERNGKQGGRLKVNQSQVCANGRVDSTPRVESLQELNGTLHHIGATGGRCGRGNPNGDEFIAKEGNRNTRTMLLAACLVSLDETLVSV